MWSNWKIKYMPLAVRTTKKNICRVSRLHKYPQPSGNVLGASRGMPSFSSPDRATGKEPPLTMKSRHSPLFNSPPQHGWLPRTERIKKQHDVSGSWGSPSTPCDLLHSPLNLACRRHPRPLPVHKGRRHPHLRRRHLRAGLLLHPLLDFETIAMATDNFSLGNRVGKGGFGAVYKGVLDDGQEVAVKRLSWNSRQGTKEFMNEAKLIAKLQHKNLVRLVGCCIQGEERMLIYEYMQNKSLDYFIFDKNKRALLDWRTRLDIILGVAKGLLYLHHDSRYKIIHRDLKACNILLDGAMNPKISDFGTARIFWADQNVEKTKRVIGTFGYMSPEYVINGAISVKSDVFSFGVLTLEMLSGAKNRGSYEDEPHLNLLSYAWKLWQEGKCLEFLDVKMTNSYDRMQFERCIQVALLCVQEHATDRPTMSTVVTMLVSENFPLPQPKRPGFLVLTSSSLGGASGSNQEFTEIDMTITIVDGR